MYMASNYTYPHVFRSLFSVCSGVNAHPRPCPGALPGAFSCMALGLACHGFPGMAACAGVADFRTCAFSTLLDLDKWLPRFACAIICLPATYETSILYVSFPRFFMYIYM